MSVDKLKEAVAQAEASVADVKDPDLRRTAFDRVLAHLLANGSTMSQVDAKASTPRRAGAEKAKTTQKLKGGPKGRLEELIGEGFFKKPRALGDVKTEFGNRGHYIALATLAKGLARLCSEKKLRRQRGVLADRSTYGYSNW